MLLKDETTIKLEPKMQKILWSSVAFNNTFVVVRIDKSSQEESIVHFDKNGKILFERKYKDIIDFFGQMNEKEVIVLNVPEQKIDIIDLSTKNVNQISHQYLFEDTASMQLETFADTQMFCVVEKGGQGDNRLRLTYYNYKDLSKPVLQWESTDNQWTYEHVVERMNNTSKIGWWTYKHEQEISFSYFDITDGKGNFSTVKARNRIAEEYQVNDILLSISYLWEIKPNKYMLVAISNKFEHKDKCKNKDGVYNNNYIIDATHGNDQAILNETKFSFEKDGDFMYNEQLTDCFGIGDISVFHTFRHDNGQVCETPIYFINNDTEEIIHKETWKSTCYASHYSFPAWDKSLVVQATHANGDVDEIKFSAQKVMNPKEISLHFLLHLYEDFDDDLLQDAIEILHG